MKTRPYVILMPLSLMTIAMNREKNPDVEEVHIFSDGPGSQFKKKYVVWLLHTFQKNLGARISWHYYTLLEALLKGHSGTQSRQ